MANARPYFFDNRNITQIFSLLLMISKLITDDITSILKDDRSSVVGQYYALFPPVSSFQIDTKDSNFVVILAEVHFHTQLSRYLDRI
jgi:hypothetical protein